MTKIVTKTTKVELVIYQILEGVGKKTVESSEFDIVMPVAGDGRTKPKKRSVTEQRGVTEVDGGSDIDLVPRIWSL